MIGKGRRQHRQHARREIHRCTALHCFRVDRSAGPDVMADVRDRDDQPKARGMRLRVNGVVEITRILAIDRDEWQLSEVFPSLRIARIDVIAPSLRLAQGVGRKLVRQIEARDRRFRGELDRAIRIEPLLHPGLRGLAPRLAC